MNTFYSPNHFIPLLYIVIVTSISVIDCGYYEDKLITDILSNRDHNPLGRPVADESESLQVEFGITLQQIIDVDEKNEMLHTNMWLNYKWFDWKLGWNETEYGGVNSIRLPAGKIWTPDILMYNSADEDIDSKYPVNIVVRSTGECSWVPLGLYISSCAIEIRWFPFDDQFCNMKFGSWTYDGSKLNLTLRSDTVELGTYQESGEWELISAPAIRNVEKYDCCPEEYIDITFTIHIRRRTLYYGFNLIIPCALISLLALLTFALPPDAGEKIGLGITILLSLSVFQMIVAEMVPPTSMAVPLVGTYFAAVMIMSTISVIMTVVVLALHHSNPDMCYMPTWVKTLICEWLAWCLFMSRPGKELTLDKLLKKASVRQLQEKVPPSQSLISNIEDIDRSISSRNEGFINGACPTTITSAAPYFRFKAEEAERITTLMGAQGELLAILTELRFITRKMKEDSQTGEETNDWKFAAMVIDRLCLVLFTLYLTIGTCVIFFRAPHIF